MKFFGKLGFGSAVGAVMMQFLRIMLVAMQVAGAAAAAVIFIILSLGAHEGIKVVHELGEHTGIAHDLGNGFQSGLEGHGGTTNDIYALYSVLMILSAGLLIKSIVVCVYVTMETVKMSDEELAANKGTFCAASFDIAGLYMPFFLMTYGAKGSKEHQSLRPKIGISKVLSLSLAISSLAGIIVYCAVLSKFTDNNFFADGKEKSISYAVIIVSAILFAISTAYTVLFNLPKANETYFKKNVMGVFMQIGAYVICIFVTFEGIVMLAIGVILLVGMIIKAGKRTKGHGYSPWRGIKTLFGAIIYSSVYVVGAIMIGRAIYGMGRNNMSAPQQEYQAIESEQQKEVFEPTKTINKVESK